MPGRAPEVGILAVTLTTEASSDPVFSGLPHELLTLQWHGDTFDLPTGATRLAGSAAYPNQAFRYGESAYGVQFHLEVSVAMASRVGRRSGVRQVPRPGTRAGLAAALIADLERRSPEMLDLGRRMFSRWLDLAEVGATAAA